VKLGRNDPCACGSGKKFKKCCGQNTSERTAQSAGGDANPAFQGFASRQETLSPADLGWLVALVKAGRYGESEIAARDLLVRYPNAGIVWKILGSSLWMQGKDALPALKRTATLLPDDPEAHSNLGNALRALARAEDAATSHRRALEIRADYAEAHNNLGSALRDLGRIDEAVASYRCAVAINRDFGMAHANLANALRSLGDLEDAVASFRQAVAIEPHCAEVLRNLGDSLLELGRADEADAAYRRALEIEPDCGEAHSNLGMALMLQNRAAEAEASCRRALEINPQLTGAIVLSAQIHAEEGRFSEAEDLLQRALSIDPDMPEAWAGLVRCRKMTREDEPWATGAKRLAERRLPPKREAHLRYALGKYFDDIEDFEQAFWNYERANELAKVSHAKFDGPGLAQSVNRITQRYGRDWFEATARHGIGAERPVFIVGMWRSGTTLAEQILTSHPAVFGAGELPFWNSASAIYERSEFGEPSEFGEDLRGMGLRKLAGDYLALLEGLSAGAARVIDKMSANFLHLGLIHATLPAARIIHMRRNPIDTCLSVYFQDFASSHPYANDLEDLAHFYSEYVRVMAHWDQMLPEGAILTVPYEKLVEDPEAGTRRMLDFIGLPWDPGCMDFHKTARRVSTASKWQVRQTINKNSIERWRNYEQFVAPLRRLTE
jgi:tetratricopeptide (TPR) repeat protein